MSEGLCIDETQAIARLKRGDPAGLEALVRLHQVQALHIAYLILGERPPAEDAAQTAFLRVYEKIAQYDPDRPFRTWFFRIVINTALQAARHRRKPALIA